MTAPLDRPLEEVLEGRALLEHILGGLQWIIEQAEGVMSVTAGCATTHGDPGGGLEWANRNASDIAINAQMPGDDINAAILKARAGKAGA